MGFLNSLIKDLQKHGEQLVLDNINSRLPEGQKVGASNNDTTLSNGNRFGSDNNNTKNQAHVPTRWEKAVMSLNSIVSQVSKFDPDGVDVICFGGSQQPDIYRYVKDIKSIESTITSKYPSGQCNMAAAIDMAFQEAYSRGFNARPCSILVLTAGRPDDHGQLDKLIMDAADEISEMIDDKSGEYKTLKESPLTITFVQIGDDEQATQYLKHLDTDLTKYSSRTGTVVDIVDTIKDEEIKEAMKEFQASGGKEGALIGAFAGAALGVGGVYLYNQAIAKKRAAQGGWNGRWKATYTDSDKIHTLTVTDDMDGSLEVSGYPKGVSTSGNYLTDDSTGGLYIQLLDPKTTEPIFGTVEDEHTISWSDGCRWEEIPPKGVHWTTYAGAAVVGAATGGATGYLMQKKFFNKASKHTKADYVIIVDRSAMMAIPDSGK
jgi:hypothetical protein